MIRNYKKAQILILFTISTIDTKHIYKNVPDVEYTGYMLRML